MPVSSPAAKKLGAAITAARVDQAYSREYVAEKTGHDLSTIQRAECGTTDIRVSPLVLIADALGVPPAHLLDGVTASLVPARVPRSENRKRIEAVRTARRPPA